MTLRLGGDGAITGCTSLENPDLTVSGLTISGSFDAEKVLVASGTAAAPSYTFSGDTDNGLYYAGTNSIGLATAGTNAILIDSTGNVGIGTTSPGANLDISSTGAVESLLSGGGTSGDTVLHLKGNGNAYKFIVPNSAAQYGMGLYDVGNAAYRLFVTGAGNVGIGTTNPLVPFVLSHDGNTNIEMGYSTGTSSHYVQAYNRSTSAYQQLDLAGNVLTFKTPTEAMRIDSSGNVGIGTTSIDFSDFGSATGGVAIEDIGGTNTGLKIGDGSNDNYLVAAGNGSFYQSHYGSGSMIFGVGNGTGTERMRIDSSGRVGIGELTPAANLEITPGTGAGTLLLNNASGSTADGALNIEVNSGGVLYESRKTGGLAHIWYTAGAERMRVLATGGLTFNGDTATANALNDYEEGTFTPTILQGADNGSGGAVPYSIQAGRYTKIGNKVYTDIFIRFATGTFSDGNHAQIGGLPFNVSNLSYGNIGAANLTRGGGTSSFHNTTNDITSNYGNANTAGFYLYKDGGVGFILGDANNVNLTGLYWIGTFCYQTDS